MVIVFYLTNIYSRHSLTGTVLSTLKVIGENVVLENTYKEIFSLRSLKICCIILLFTAYTYVDVMLFITTMKPRHNWNQNIKYVKHIFAR